ncbi:MAG: cation-translocating P-type ATPase, partial [Kiritimatiellae bacterium]|nr:cation-translocating P-type ATPase [Kiritimatiellia bacterium]
MRIYEFNISGMRNAACATAVERATRRLAGVESSSVSLFTGCLRLRGSAVSLSAVVEAVAKAGYSAEPRADKTLQDRMDALSAARQRQAECIRLIASLLFALLLLYAGFSPTIGLPFPVSVVEQPALYAVVQIALLLPVIAASSDRFVRGFRQAAAMQPDMDTLIALGASAAVLYSLVSFVRILRGDGNAVRDMYWDSSGTILAFAMLGDFLAQQTERRTGDAVEQFTRLTPAHTTLIQEDGTIRKLSVSLLMPGDHLLVHPGERIPADGELISPLASVDESMLTDGSIPVEKTIGDTLHCGSVNGAQSFTMRVLRVGDDTSLAKMIRLVASAQHSKAPSYHLVDRVSG